MRIKKTKERNKELHIKTALTFLFRMAIPIFDILFLFIGSNKAGKIFCLRLFFRVRSSQKLKNLMLNIQERYFLKFTEIIFFFHFSEIQ